MAYGLRAPIGVLKVNIPPSARSSSMVFFFLFFGTAAASSLVFSSFGASSDVGDETWNSVVGLFLTATCGRSTWFLGTENPATRGTVTWRTAKLTKTVSFIFGDLKRIQDVAIGV